jgi:hypothetical protein
LITLCPTINYSGQGNGRANIRHSQLVYIAGGPATFCLHGYSGGPHEGIDR